jgi:hypothetical protein
MFWLSRMRAKAEEFMTDQCVIEQHIEATNAAGFPAAQVWGAVVTTKCRIIDAGETNQGSTTQVGDRTTTSDMPKLVVPYGTPLAEGQRVTLLRTGDVYQIVRLITARTDAVDAQAVIAKE